MTTANVGKPVQVTGCEVRQRRVSMLLNVPRVTGASRFEIRRGKRVLGRLDGKRLRQLSGGGK